MSERLDAIEQRDDLALRYEPDYIDRTITTVRNHAGADNCWPQWANIFADTIEDYRAALARLEAERAALVEVARAAEGYVKAEAADDEALGRLLENDTDERRDEQKATRREADERFAALTRALAVLSGPEKEQQ